MDNFELFGKIEDFMGLMEEEKWEYLWITKVIA